MNKASHTNFKMTKIIIQRIAKQTRKRKRLTSQPKKWVLERGHKVVWKRQRVREMRSKLEPIEEEA